MPERGGDAALEALGVHRIPVPIPFPQAGGPVNVVAVEEEGGGIALFDTGLGTSEAEAALVAGLQARGWSYADVRRIFITHGHVDHYGLAKTIRRASGAAVFVHPADRWKVIAPSPWDELAPRYRDFLIEAGADPEAREAMLAFASGTDRFAARLLEPVGDLVEGMRLRFASCDAEILSMPGHTPGLICAVIEPRGVAGSRLLVADDHLLEKVSPNPLLELCADGSRFRALPAYFASLERVERLDLDWIVPGHGACFPDHRAVIAGLRAFYELRQAKLLALVPEEGATPFELLHAFFPRARPAEFYLMLGEILGNLDLLEDAGRVRCSRAQGLLRYLPMESLQGR